MFFFIILYLLSNASSSFCFGYFGDRVLFFAQASLDHDSPILCFLLGIRACSNMPNIFPLKYVLTDFFCPLWLGTRSSQSQSSKWLGLQVCDQFHRLAHFLQHLQISFLIWSEYWSVFFSSHITIDNLRYC
jgi:hypothetical protein